MVDYVVCVVGLDKRTGFIKAVTSCDNKDANKYAKYYRSIGYNLRIIDYDELDVMLNKESKYRRQHSFEN